MRLFVAIELSESHRASLTNVQAKLSRRCDGVRWIPGPQLHMTVKFLGEVKDDDVPAVSKAVAAGAARAVPFEMEVGGCGCFPPRGAVRIVWVGVREASNALLECVESVSEELERMGFPTERKPFSSHITIGRVREDRSGGKLRSAVDECTFPPLVQPVELVTLMSSVLSSKGPAYSTVSKADLGRGEPASKERSVE